MNEEPYCSKFIFQLFIHKNNLCIFETFKVILTLQTQTLQSCKLLSSKIYLKY